GEGIETLSPRAWAGALDLLAGQRPQAFIKAARTLVEQGDFGLALKIIDLALVNHASSEELKDLRRRALDGLRATYQQMTPFKFIVSSEWERADLAPVECPPPRAAHGHGVDDNPNCRRPADTWTGNVFATASPDCLR